MKSILCLCFLLPAMLLAQGPLSVENAFIAAQAHSESLQIATESSTQAVEGAKQVWGKMAPQINAQVYESWHFSPLGQYPTQGSNPSAVPIFRATATQPLFRGGTLRAALDLASSSKDSTKQNQDWVRTQLFIAVHAAFNERLAAENDLRILESEALLFDQRIRDLKERVSIGRSQSNEVLSFEAARAQLEAQIAASRGSVASTRGSLAFLTGLETDSPLVDVDLAQSNIEDLESILKRVPQRPDVIAATLRVRSAEAAWRIAKGGHWPNLDLNANYYAYSSDVAVPATQSNRSLWDLQLLLSVPIFAGGQISSKSRQAESVLVQARLELLRSTRAAEQELRLLHMTLNSDLAQLEALKNAVELSEKNYKEQNHKYRLSLVTNIDVLQALTSFEESQRAYGRTNYRYRTNLARLAAASARVP